MKTIIAGPRWISYPSMEKRDYTVREIEWMIENLDEYHSSYPITEVVSGRARGGDFIGEAWAEQRNIPIAKFPYIKELGKAGGYVRNKQMADYADRAIVFWDNVSKGSKHMIDIMENVEKPCTIWKLDYFHGELG